MDYANALTRMRRIFKSFDYITTNSIGSHVAYAAYSGAKVSIYGPYDFQDKASLKNDALYSRYEDVLNYTLEVSSFEYLSRQYPYLFFMHPIQAKRIESKGKEWLGAENYIEHPWQVAKFLVWHPSDQAYNWSDKISNKVLKTSKVFMASK
jgi:hypothetical protein